MKNLRNKIKEIINYNDGEYYSRRLSESYFKRNYLNIYNMINKLYNNDFSFNEKLYHIVYDIDKLPTCKICNSKVRFRKFSKGYSKYCSMICIGKDKDIQKKREETSLKTIGVKYTLQSKEKREQIKKTNLEKYGVEHPMYSKEIKNKMIQTNLEKYGVEHHLKLESQKEKQRKTNLKKYGVENVMQVKEIKSKAEKTNLERYGVKSPIQNKNIRKKIKKTNLEKYGVEHLFQNENVKEKIKQTNLERYGVEYASQNDNIKNKIIQKNILNSEDRLKKSKITNLEKYGVENPFQSEQIIENIKLKNTLNFRKKYSKILNINKDDIIINKDNLIIKNYCKKHPNGFEITKSLLYSRLMNKKLQNICTKCYPINEQSSIKEKELIEYIKLFNINYIQNNRNIISPYELDIYLPNHKLAIEFNGLYYHSELFKSKNYHLNKLKLCNENNINLIHIFENEWMYKSNVVKSIIRNKLNLITNKIYARNTIVKEIISKESKEFLDNNHLQGNINSKIKLGLFYNDELVSVMTFEKMRKSLGNINNKNNYYNISRFCNKINTNVIGGASKLLNYFIKKYNPKCIISYADKRYSNGDLYKTLGFERIHETKPNYYYIKDYNKYHRFNFRKDKLKKLGWLKEGEDKTEHEIMLERGYYRIYDCGNIKYEMKL